MKIIELIDADYGLLSILLRLDIQLPFGDISIGEMCRRYDMSSALFLMICRMYACPDYEPDAASLTAADLPHLVRYLRSSHRYWLDTVIPRIGRGVDDVLRSCDRMQAELAGTVCLLCSCYSLKDMNGAGWIATINNYLWPLACFIGMLLILKKILQGQPIKWYAGAAGLILAVLTCNHEQGVAATFASIFCCILYMAWKKIKINKWVWGYLSVAIASLIFILSCPGNAARKQTEISTYFQDFPELTLWNKLDMGITPICHYSIIDNNYLFLVFLSLLCIAVWKMPVASWKKDRKSVV